MSGIRNGESFIMAEFNEADYKIIIGNLEKITPKRMDIRNAINRAATEAAHTAMTHSKRRLASEYTMPVSKIAKTMRVYKNGTGPHGMAIGLKISDTMRPVSDFSFTPKKLPAKEITVEIKKGIKTVLPKTFTGPFLTKMPTGHIAPFYRKGKSRMPIYEARAISTVGMFKAAEEKHKIVWDIMFQKFEERVIHHIHFMLDK
jgi:hypothetical protein